MQKWYIVAQNLLYSSRACIPAGIAQEQVEGWQSCIVYSQEVMVSSGGRWIESDPSWRQWNGPRLGVVVAALRTRGGLVVAAMEWALSLVSPLADACPPRAE